MLLSKSDDALIASLACQLLHLVPTHDPIQAVARAKKILETARAVCDCDHAETERVQALEAAALKKAAA